MEVYSYMEDAFENAYNAKGALRGNTGLVYDKKMVNHKCLWDPSHKECPERFIKTLERCEELGLVERCNQVAARPATLTELLTVHTQEHIDQLAFTDNYPSSDLDLMEKLASKYDSIYIHPETYKLSLLAAGSSIQLINEICSGKVQNGMAIVRPPGHHAMSNEFCGFCYFNNVALAARHALDQLGIQKILIIDWDVHHGQATQQMFYNDPRVVYFSIHRYEHGNFWPNLRESDFDYVGEDKGSGFNFNVPLNVTGLGDVDYLAIFHHILLPMATEFQPELIIISAGYDAAVGCPEGEMTVTPACYAHLVSLIMGLASGRIAVILEGGYCLRSLAEGAALTLRALLGDPCPNLPPMPMPSKSIQETILNCIYSHRPYWQCFQIQGSYLRRDRDPNNEKQHWPQIHYNYTQPKPETYPTRDTAPFQSQQVMDHCVQILDLLVAETKLSKPKHAVCLTYNSLMMNHKHMRDTGHPERPSRILKIYEKHVEYNLLDRIFFLQGRSATREELLMVHEETYLKELEQICCLSEKMTSDVKRQHSVLEKKDSVYIHPQSYSCASYAVGSVLQVVDSVMQGESRSGVAIVRPPGHHAEPFKACGFCLFNNVSIAAKYAAKHYSVQRILILDWDVHHGNGTQRTFLSDPHVLYISVHRYDRGTFFPASEDAAATEVGFGPGVGFNVNLPWNEKGMGNAEYITAFQEMILPIAYQYSPELVLVSAGFDAAVGDPLGGCKVTPDCYGLLTSWLTPLAMGRVILCLEGGYNLHSISYSMTMCTKTLLGDPVPIVEVNLPIKPSAIQDLKTALDVQIKHWPALCFTKQLPEQNLTAKKVNEKNVNQSYPGGKYADTNKHSSPYHLHEKFDLEMYISEDKLHQKKSNVSSCSQLDTQINGKESNLSSSVDTKPGLSKSTSFPDTTKHSFSINVECILKELGVGEGEGFAVHPLTDCPHVPAVSPVPVSGIHFTDPCLHCIPEASGTSENWICLTCYSVFCGRIIREHMLLHFTESSHPIVMGFQDLSVWCYCCDSYIESPILYEAKNAVHISKFGEAMPNIYKS